MPIRQVPPGQAAHELAADPSAVYLDVRTPEEFDAGHPAGARNVPVLLLDPATRRPQPNAEFLARGAAPPARRRRGCWSGARAACARSGRASCSPRPATPTWPTCAAASAARRTRPGWKESGLPVETGARGPPDLGGSPPGQPPMTPRMAAASASASAAAMASGKCSNSSRSSRRTCASSRSANAASDRRERGVAVGGRDPVAQRLQPAVVGDQRVEQRGAVAVARRPRAQEREQHVLLGAEVRHEVACRRRRACRRRGSAACSPASWPSPGPAARGGGGGTRAPSASRCWCDSGIRLGWRRRRGMASALSPQQSPASTGSAVRTTG